MSEEKNSQAVQPAVHIFDIDLTILRKTSAEYFLRLALKEKLIKFSQVSGLFIDLIKYKAALVNLDFIENTVKKLSGLKKEDLERLSGVCFETKINPNIYKGAASLIREFLQKGERVIFATSSLDFIIKPLEIYFNTEESLATKLEYKDGITTGNIDGYSFFGKNKRQAAMDWLEKHNIDKSNVYFYSDSYTDIPLLEYCNHPVAVNPDRILKKKALKSGWKIINFNEVLGS